MDEENGVRALVTELKAHLALLLLLAVDVAILLCAEARKRTTQAAQKLTYPPVDAFAVQALVLGTALRVRW